MPAGKRQENNVRLYTVITFISLFIVMTVAAVALYVKFEEQRKKAINAEAELEKVVSSAEQRKLAGLVGKTTGKQSTVGALLSYLDEGILLILGSPLEEASAEDKVAKAQARTKEILEALAEAAIMKPVEDPNTTGLLSVVYELKTSVETLSNAFTAKDRQYEELHARFDEAYDEMAKNESDLLAEKLEYKNQVEQVTKDYKELEEFSSKSTAEQVSSVQRKLEAANQTIRELSSDLLQTQAKLSMAKEKLALTEKKLAKLVPPPDSAAAAFIPDGKIMLIDNQNNIVHINIGTNNQVYQGLTFSVYDRNAPIPKDGKGKAEIEVYSVSKDIAAARIIRSEIRRPISRDDMIANLIWDSSETKVFTVAGDFDLDDNGDIDFDGNANVKALIEKWGGKVLDSATINTDFVVLGEAPKVGSKPTFEQVVIDPLAMDKYEASMERRKNYRLTEERAQDLSIHILNTERFLYFIGYKTQAQKAGAF